MRGDKAARRGSGPAPTYTRRPYEEALPAIQRARVAIRGGAAASIGAAIAVPLLRRRLRIPAPVTIAACAAGPLALAVLIPRSKKRDVALYALQMWAFIMVHELPYDDPEALRARLRSRYPIVVDRAIGAGKLPERPPAAGARPAAAVGAVDRILTWAHWLWFFEPYVALALILVRDNERFPRAARQMAAVYDLGCAVYFAVPTAPPWWASEQGLTGEEVRRIMVEVGEETWGSAWPKMYDALGGNPWAAMPSLHFATSRLGGALARPSRPGRGRARLGLRADPRLRARLSRRALRHRSGSPARAWSPPSSAASRWPSRSSTGQPAPCSAWSDCASG